MKRILGLVLFAAVSGGSLFASNFSQFLGVWASDEAEAVVTDSACIFFEQTPLGLRAYCNVPTRALYSRTCYKDSTFVVDTTEPLVLKEEEMTVNGVNQRCLRIGDKVMRKVEDIITCPPYEKAPAKSITDIGRCLQEWRLGAKFGKKEDVCMCEINTNRHMFIYLINPYMTYIRAAATANNNHGTLFCQNIRMMRNNNRGEMTSYMAPDNYAVASNNLKIDNSLFNPSACAFTKDGGIYWSFISFTTEQIQINGCGETYYINRDDPCEEYFKYIPYEDAVPCKAAR